VIRPQRRAVVHPHPGATEFAYDPNTVREVVRPGHKATVNRHLDGAGTDWEASLDELQAVCPNLESVALVVSWFGDDLRADRCELKPGVVDDLCQRHHSPRFALAACHRGTRNL